MDGNVAVLSGLKAGETVVVSGNFLIDSESRLKTSMSGMDR
jgi:membrane fusion protein, copper/silver efflux system